MEQQVWQKREFDSIAPDTISYEYWLMAVWPDLFAVFVIHRTRGD